MVERLHPAATRPCKRATHPNCPGWIQRRQGRQFCKWCSKVRRPSGKPRGRPPKPRLTLTGTTIDTDLTDGA